LSETIEGARQEADGAGSLRVCKPSALLAIYSLCQVAMEEGVGDVQLVRGPMLGGDDDKDGPDGGWLNDKCERFTEVHARSLMEATNHPPGLVELECVVRVQLVFKHPLAGDHASTGRTLDDCPDLVTKKRVVFSLHGVTPGWILECRADRRGHRRDARYGACHGIFGIGFVDAGLCSGHHVVLGMELLRGGRSGGGVVANGAGWRRGSWCAGGVLAGTRWRRGAWYALRWEWEASPSG
jgi:hypothetical protein